MRIHIAAFLILISCLNVFSKASAQKINLQFKQVELETVFKAIERQVDYGFAYGVALLANSKPITVELKNVTLTEALDHIFKDLPYRYEIVNKTILVKAKVLKKEPSTPEKSKPIRIAGRITDMKNNPIPNVTVRVKGQNIGTLTDKDGLYTIEAEPTAILVFTSIGFQASQIVINNQTEINLTLQELTAQLKEITVQTGYESVKPERFVGSAAVIDSALLARVAGADLVSRLENQVNALLFNRAGGTTRLQLRGVSTIQGASDIATTTTVNPLIILDNFPYNGSLSSINPNSIESISVLKDAVAFSMWGARAGNGVIVIKTKQGMKNTKTSVNFSSNLLILEKPDLAYYNKMKSSDFIDVEQFLFSKGYFDFTFRSPQFTTVSPVIEILNKRKNGLITDQEAQSIINELRGHSVIDDYKRYVLRNGVQFQNFLSINGGGQKAGFNISIGSDNNKSSIKGPGARNRYTLNADFTYEPIKKVNVTGRIIFFDDETRSDGPGYQISPGAGKLELYPYAKLADENGVPLATPSKYIPGYVDTVGRGRLLDWKYRPLDENEFANGRVKTQFVQVNAAASYQILPWLSSQLTFQLGKQGADTRTLYDQRTFFTRDLINQFTNPTSFKQVIPPGGILDRGRRILTNQNFRAQFNLAKQFDMHEVKALLAGEISNAKLEDNANRTYGYDGANLTFANNLNFTDPFPLFYTGTARIDNPMTMANKPNASCL